VTDEEGLARWREHRLSLVLLLVIYLNLTWSIQGARWAEGLHILPWVVLGAVVLGFMLAISRWPARAAHGYILFVGLIANSLLLCTLVSPELSWQDRLIEVGLRLYRWLLVLLGGGTSYDNLVFVAELTLLLWLVGYVSAWQYFRHRRLWWALFPPTAGLMFNLYYAPPELMPYFMIHLGLCLLLLIRHRLHQRQGEWQKARILAGDEARFDIIRDGLVIALLALFLAWTLPGAQQVKALARFGERLERPVRTVKEEWNRLFASLQRYGTGRELTFGPTKLLAGEVQLTDAPIADIQAAEGRYWAAAAYDYYGGRGWAATYTDRGPLGERSSPMAEPPYQMRKKVEQVVRVRWPAMRIILAAPLLYQVDIPAEAQLLYLPREGATAARPPADIQMAFPQHRLYEDDVYRVTSLVSVADEESLRSAGTDYPDWVRQYYLQLPQDVPRRLLWLARFLTRGYTNNYDKALAIEAFLRNIPYNERVEAPPPTEDAVEYFIFMMRQGYCDYYASAMVVLARIAGIPARFVQGYVVGAPDENGVYHILEKNGHAWAELYFPKYGWIIFEPTPAQPLPVRYASRVEALTAEAARRPAPTNPLSEEEKFGPDIAPLGEETGPFGVGRLPAPARAGAEAGIVLAGLGLLGGILWLVWRLMEPRRLTPAERAYLRLTRFAPVLAGVRAQPTWTPYEFAGVLARRAPAAGGSVRALTDMFVRQRYGPAGAAPAEGDPMQVWRRARAELLRARVSGVYARVVRLMRPAEGYAGSSGRVK